MDARKELLIVNGKDKTDSIESFHYSGGKYDITYKTGPKVYSYNSNNIRWLHLVKTLDPKRYIIRYEGKVISCITAIYDFDEWVWIERGDYKAHSFPKCQLKFEENCLSDNESQELMAYFHTVADAISLTNEDDVKILSKQYERIKQISDTTVLARYLSQKDPDSHIINLKSFIYPFGLNLSQKTAIENAFSSQVSVIQGPPGTGKTQTILNIIANALMQGKSIAVVSNNNSATANVVEKLDKYGLSFLTAFLGNRANKEAFLLQQDGHYPDMQNWKLDLDKKQFLISAIQKLIEDLNETLRAKNRIAEIQREEAAIRRENQYFNEYFEAIRTERDIDYSIRKLKPGQALGLWLECEYQAESGDSLRILKRIRSFLKYGLSGTRLLKKPAEFSIPALQKAYYTAKISELTIEKASLQHKLDNYKFEEKLKELSEKSMQLLKAELSSRFIKANQRPIFDKTAFSSEQERFIKDYPVILSTTYSVRTTLSGEYIYDYLLVDEASQVDVVTGALAFSCAKNVVIVGDQKQLPNVVHEATRKVADEIWSRYTFDKAYNYSNHSLLSSVTAVWQDVPSVLLREHYRCHPKIAGFINQKFYDDQLIILTKDNGENDVLSVLRTIPGSHARGHLNQRQIDAVQQEILPQLLKSGHKDIGIIAPYRDQVSALKKQLPDVYEIDTVHKFQGREKEAIVLSTVDDTITDFVDDPHMLNVAVSRAVKCLSIIMSGNAGNELTNIAALSKYIEYNNFEIKDSNVFSVFDLLYKGYSEKRRDFLKSHNRISEYDSENLIYAIIESMLKKPEFKSVDCVVHTPLNTLIRDYSLLTQDEAMFARNPLTHMDFLLYHKMDKHPVLVIEVDGFRYHQEGTRQAERDSLKNSILEKCGVPVLRLRTNESGEEKRLIDRLSEVLSLNTLDLS